MSRLETARSVAVILLVVAVLASCSGDGGEGASDSTGPPSTTTTIRPTTTAVTAPPPTFPLTGLPLDDPVKGARPAAVVKIENSRRAQGIQDGLSAADLVYVEKVEGGVTRVAAVFHSADAESVGPVRSARTTDVVLTGDLNRPLFAFSGANVGVLRQISVANVVNVSWDALPKAYRGSGVLGLFTSTPALYEAVPQPPPGPPAPLFAYGPTPAGTVVAGVDATYGSAVDTQVRWERGAGGWVRSQDGAPHVDGAGIRVSAANVVFQMVEYRDSGFSDITGAPSPEAVLVGEGEALVLTGGRLVPGRWARARPEDPTALTTAAGRPLTLQPGRTWVELVPAGSVTPL